MLNPKPLFQLEKRIFSLASVVLFATTATLSSLEEKTFAQNSDDYQIPSSSLSGGGGISSGGEFSVIGTIGQPASGPIQGGEFEFQSGYLASECFSCAQGDFDCDSFINGADLTVLLSNWGECPKAESSCLGEINSDGTVDGEDLAILLANWG